MEPRQKPSNSKRHNSHMSFRLNSLKETMCHSWIRPGAFWRQAFGAEVDPTGSSLGDCARVAGRDHCMHAETRRRVVCPVLARCLVNPCQLRWASPDESDCVVTRMGHLRQVSTDGIRWRPLFYVLMHIIGKSTSFGRLMMAGRGRIG